MTLGVPTSPGVAGGRGARHAARALQRPRLGRARLRRRIAARSPRSSSSRSPATWAWCRRATDSSRACARSATASGTLLVFDEVISGFRAAAGGAQQVFGVRPDLTCLGKIIGGGLPVGAYGGRADVMELVAPVGPGLSGGNAVGQSAGDDRGALVARASCRRSSIGTWRSWARSWPSGLADAARDAGVPLQVNAFGSLRHAVLHEPAGARLPVGAGGRHRRLRGVLPRHARARRLSAAVAVRSVVPLRRRTPSGISRRRSRRRGKR